MDQMTDLDRTTVIRRPTPGKGGGASVRPSRSGTKTPARRPRVSKISSSINPLVSASSRLMQLGAKISMGHQYPDTQALFETMLREIEQFEQVARGLGCNANDCNVAHYLLCAFIDEMVLTQAWGIDSPWANRTLLDHFSRRSDLHARNERSKDFFKVVNGLLKSPSLTLHLLELAYLLLNFGFTGHYRHRGIEGQQRLQQLTDELYRVILNGRGEAPEISEQPQMARGPSLRRLLPVWVVAIFLVAFICVPFYTYFWWDLDKRKLAFEDSLLSFATATIIPPVVEPQAVTVVDPEPPENLSDFLQSRLPEDFASGRFVVMERDGQERVVLQGDGFFKAAQANLDSESVALISRLAGALKDLDSVWIVRGHSDNVAIRSTVYPSNWELSKARAQAVYSVLLPKLPAGTLQSAEAMADKDPISRNDTPQGRAMNRRVEIVRISE